MVAYPRHLIIRLRSLAILLLCSACLLAPSANADSYQVNASVPYPAPTQPAVVDPGLDGTTVSAALQAISGTCQLQNPADVVSIWRGGTSIGSTTCNGSFSLQIMLVPGANTLVARTANASMLYGPDSAAFTITLVLPPEPIQPATPPSDEPTTPAEVTSSTNQAAATELIATTADPFSVLSSINEVTITISVGGGQNPYTVNLNWGDGSVESRNLDQPGVYTFKHIYAVDGNYIIRGSVRDVLGATTLFSYAVVSKSKTGSPPAVKNKTDDRSFWSSIAIPLLVTICVLILAVLAYILGVHDATKRRLKKNKSMLKKTASIIAPRKKRPVRKRT